MRSGIDFLPELLAPAGSPEAVIAAVQNGADAVYLGIGEFNARRGAKNFNSEELLFIPSKNELRPGAIFISEKSGSNFIFKYFIKSLLLPIFFKRPRLE